MRQIAGHLLLLGLILSGSCAANAAATIRGVLVPEDPCGNVTLDISNQDRSVDPLDISVFLDGTPIIRAKIAIGQIHPSYERYRFKWTPGPHEIRVESTRVRAKLVEKVEVQDKRFLAVLYGYPPLATGFTFGNH